jgi:phosphate-selective porin OprO and OprP
LLLFSFSTKNEEFNVLYTFNGASDLFLDITSKPESGIAIARSRRCYTPQKNIHDKKYSILCCSLVLLFLMIFPGDVLAERIYLAGYNGGFYIRSEEEGGIDMRLGGSFYVDYRAYAESDRTDNRFDIRRARLLFNGQLTRWFRYAAEYEFEGDVTSHLVDLYGEFVFNGPRALRFGQFKEPFSLEWQTPDKAILFAERSMGYYLMPGRDVGTMFSGSMNKGSVFYGIGLFNGNGVSGSPRGNESDTPEITGRAAIKPFLNTNTDLLRNLQVGASASYAKINTANINVNVKSTGMANLTTRSLYILNPNTKFGMIEDVDSRMRGNLESAWIYGPIAVTGEYFYLKYKDLKTAEKAPADADFSSWYGSLAWCVTGEDFSLAGGVMNPIYPAKFFNPDEGAYGALILATRFDHFKGDKAWITQGANVSVRDANAVSVCATWVLFPMLRVMTDYTYTGLSDPIKVRVNNDGSIDYINHENVLTLRLAMDF